jgi:hypothetical protein
MALNVIASPMLQYFAAYFQFMRADLPHDHA